MRLALVSPVYLSIESQRVLGAEDNLVLETFQTAKEFQIRLGIPGNLARFLESKGLNVRIYNLDRLNKNIEIGDDRRYSLSSKGFYLPNENIIDIARNCPSRVKYHETGHCVFDDKGEDGIFESPDYLGPSRRDFAKGLRKTDSYPRLKEYFGGIFSDPKKINEETLHETFASFFSYWIDGENTTINPFFEAMVYMGRGLKED